ncbi:hypothetical protein ACMFMG_011727 [Clarireedia jacksonii]
MSKHLTDNNHDSQQTQRRRRPDPLSSDSPPSKTLADKQTTENTSTKTKLPVATTGLAPPALPTVTLASPPATIPGVNESCTAESMTTEPLVGNLVDSNLKARDSASLKPPQSASVLLSPYNLLNGRDELVFDDSDRISNIAENPVIVPPIQNEKDAAESVAGGREPHQDEVSWKEVKKRKTLHEYVDVDPPKKRLPEFNAKVSLDCDGDTRLFITITKNGPNTRFEVAQEE